MARKPRVHLPGGYYHVMMRGNVGKDIFFSLDDHLQFLRLIEKGLERYDHRVHAFCLMSNHVHLLIQVGAMPLGRIMQNLGMRYTQYVNKRRNEVGHLFQGRYKAILVEADAYLLELARYIHLNPVRAGLCKSVDEYELSSYHAYMGNEAMPWLYTTDILARFSSVESKARELMQAFTVSGMVEAWRPEFHHGSHLGQLLGDDHFAAQALQASGNFGMIKPPTVVQVLDAVCRAYGIGEAALHEAGKGRNHSEACAMAAIIIQELEGITLTALANELGRDLSALSQSAGRLRKRMSGNKDIREKFLDISIAIKTPNCQS